MSVKVQSLVWASELPPHQRLVLLAYADHANDDGASIYPGEERMALKTGYSRASVYRTTRELINLGVLVQTKRGYRGQRAEFRIHLEWFASHTETLSKPKESHPAPKGSHPDRERVSSDAEKGLTHKTPNISEPSEEPSEEDMSLARRDLLWETFVEIHGEPADRGERGKYNAAVKRLRDAGVDEREYPALVHAYVSRYQGSQPAAMTVAGRVGEMRQFVKKGPIVGRSGKEAQREAERQSLLRMIDELEEQDDSGGVEGDRRVREGPIPELDVARSDSGGAVP